MNYKNFIQNKYLKAERSGFKAGDINPILFDFQSDLVKWALELGKAAIFANTGLGKTFMQLEWANHVQSYTNKPVLILAPLAVSHQTIREAEKLGLTVKYIEQDSDVINGLNITNYEKLDRFDVSVFSGIVLDESSILKSFTGKYRTDIIENFKHTPYKLACSATPAPNDYMELGNHSEFLNIMSRTEMLSMFFYHDGGDTSKWRLKGHAEDRFWEWVASWAAILKNPSDLGYDGSRYDLPALNTQQMIVKTEVTEGQFFAMAASTLEERRQAKRDSLQARCEKAAEIVNNSDEIFLLWCELNDESELLRKLIKDSVEVKGSDDPEYKAKSLLSFADGNIKTLISKAKIAGYGLNLQKCHNMIFVGLTDSYEQYYQAVRRCWRFGQTEQVNVYIISSDREGNIIKNIERKEKDMTNMQESMIEHTKKYVRDNIKITFKELDKSYKANKEMVVPAWLVSEKELVYEGT